MRKWLPVYVLLMTGLTVRSQHPFRFDHTVYQGVYLTEAFQLMDTMQSYLLLDVRSPGEFADTSVATALNIGRIKGAVNISIDSIPAHLGQLKRYAAQPVFVYCSHSQRSRRVSKLLAENGFQHIYNINGGMTMANTFTRAQFPYKDRLESPNLNYRNISSMDAYQLMNTPGLVIIDIRSERAFASRDSIRQNNIGHLKNAINIPQEQFSKKLDALHIPPGSPILIYDLEGYNSMDVVDTLRDKGYTRIYNLFEGQRAFMSDHAVQKQSGKKIFIDAPDYNLIDAETCIALLQDEKKLLILDTRPNDEFNNQSGHAYMNLGRIRGAVHVTGPDSLTRILHEKDKSRPVLVYGSGSEWESEVCGALKKNGFKNVYELSQGFYHLVWSVANIEDCRDGAAFLVNHEGLY